MHKYDFYVKCFIIHVELLAFCSRLQSCVATVIAEDSSPYHLNRPFVICAKYESLKWS